MASMRRLARARPARHLGMGYVGLPLMWRGPGRVLGHRLRHRPAQGGRLNAEGAPSTYRDAIRRRSPLAVPGDGRLRRDRRPRASLICVPTPLARTASRILIRPRTLRRSSRPFVLASSSCSNRHLPAPRRRW
jgi:hypothetical protein